VLPNRYKHSFGFIEQEVKELLSITGLSNRAKEVKNWYNGYRIKNTEIYCPWDVLNYVSDLQADKTHLQDVIGKTPAITILFGASSDRKTSM